MNAAVITLLLGIFAMLVIIGVVLSFLLEQTGAIVEALEDALEPIDEDT